MNSNKLKISTNKAVIIKTRKIAAKTKAVIRADFFENAE